MNREQKRYIKEDATNGIRGEYRCEICGPIPSENVENHWDDEEHKRLWDIELENMLEFRGYFERAFFPGATSLYSGLPTSPQWRLRRFYVYSKLLADWGRDIPQFGGYFRTCRRFSYETEKGESLSERVKHLRGFIDLFGEYLGSPHPYYDSDGTLHPIGPGYSLIAGRKPTPTPTLYIPYHIELTTRDFLGPTPEQFQELKLMCQE